MLFKCMLAMKKVSKNLKSVEDKIMGVQEFASYRAITENNVWN